MDTTQRQTFRRPTAPAHRPDLGELVRYIPSGSPVRAAFVMNVHQDGETVDLVVLGEGDPRQEVTRASWAHGHGVVRARLDVPHLSRVQGPGTIAWAFLEELGG